MQHWESQIETQMKTQIQQHWDTFEKKWENKIEQLEPWSVEGTISMAENPI